MDLSKYNIFASQKQVTELTKQVSDWQAKYEVLEKDLKDAQDTIGNFMAEKEAFTKTLQAQKAELESKVTVAENKVEETKESLNKKVTAQLASIGIPEGSVKEDKSIVMDENNLSEMMKNDKGYFAKNKNDILKVAGIDPKQWDLNKK